MNLPRVGTGVVLFAMGARTWWCCFAYTSGQLDGWALSIAGFVTMLVAVYHAFGIPLDGTKEDKPS